MHTSKAAPLTVLATLGLITFCGGLDAQVAPAEKSFSWAKKFGGDYGYGKAEAHAEIRRIDQRQFEVKWIGGWPIRVERRDALDYNAELRGSVGMFGYSRTLGYAQAQLYVKQGYYSRNPEHYISGTPQTNQLYAHLYARAFGNTIVDETRRYSSEILSFGDRYDGFGVSQDFWVGPVPVTVRGRVGGGCAIAGSVILDADYANPRIGMSGSASGYASASASAGVGISGCSVGVSARVKLLSTSVALEAAANRDDVAGYVRVSVQALILKLYLYAECLWWRYERTVFGWSTDEWSQRYNLF